jgi:hypothetical protein
VISHESVVPDRLFTDDRNPVKNLRLRTPAVLGFVVALASSAARPALADGAPVPPELAPPPVAHVSSGELAVPSAERSQPVELLTVAHPSRVAAFIFGGVAAVGIGVGIGFGVAALHDNSQYDPRTSPLSAASLGNQNAVVSDVGFGAAAIAGVTSLVLFLRKDPDDAPPRDPKAISFTMSPTAGPHGAGAAAVLHF